MRDLDTEDDGADKKYLTKEVPGQCAAMVDVTVDAELAGGDYAIVIETETEDGEKETLKADLHVSMRRFRRRSFCIRNGSILTVWQTIIM